MTSLCPDFSTAQCQKRNYNKIIWIKTIITGIAILVRRSLTQVAVILGTRSSWSWYRALPTTAAACRDARPTIAAVATRCRSLQRWSCCWAGRWGPTLRRGRLSSCGTRRRPNWLRSRFRSVWSCPERRRTRCPPSYQLCTRSSLCYLRATERRLIPTWPRTI